MELVIVAIVLALSAVVATGNLLWIWLAILVGAWWVGIKAYRIRCARCGEKALLGRRMKFCNQCGADQTNRPGFRIRCTSCRKATRSELNLSYCNGCGDRLPPA